MHITLGDFRDLYEKEKADFDVVLRGITDGTGIFSRASTVLAQSFSVAQTCCISWDFSILTKSV